MATKYIRNLLPGNSAHSSLARLRAGERVRGCYQVASVRRLGQGTDIAWEVTLADASGRLPALAHHVLFDRIDHLPRGTAVLVELRTRRRDGQLIAELSDLQVMSANDDVPPVSH